MTESKWERFVYAVKHPTPLVALNNVVVFSYFMFCGTTIATIATFYTAFKGVPNWMMFGWGLFTFGLAGSQYMDLRKNVNAYDNLKKMMGAK